jgi:TRAP-type C4-dicarboxylate transport system permease small subunit
MSAATSREPAGNAGQAGGLLARLNANGERWLLLFFYGTIICTIAVDVVRRFVLGFSSVWGEEIARYAFVYLTWIGAAVAVRDRAHIRIDTLQNALPPRGKALLLMLADFFTLAFACFAVWLSLEPVLTSIRFDSVTPGLRVGQAWFLAAVPLGFACVIVRVLQSMRRDMRDFMLGREPFQGEKLFD